MNDADKTPGVVAGETLEQVGASSPEPVAQEVPRKEISTGRSAFFVGAGILISRIVGLVRQRIFAHYFGSSAERRRLQCGVQDSQFPPERIRRRAPLRFLYSGLCKATGAGR